MKQQNEAEQNKICQVRDFLKKAEQMKDAFITVSLTDEYIVDFWPDMNGCSKNGEKHTLNGKEEKVLEIRIFNADQERKLFRGDIGRRFHEGVISDQETGLDFYDETQLLDIDEKRSESLFQESGRVMSMGGGSYFLPLKSMKDARVRIRYYLDCYPESGQARICGWRLVQFTNGTEMVEE